MRRRWAMAAFAVALLAAACGGGGDSSNSGDGGGTASPDSSQPADAATTSSTSSTSTTALPPPVTLAFGGDVHFEPPIAQLLRANPSTVLSAIEPALSAADVAMVNLETAITTGGRKENKTYTFRAPPSAFTALKSAGIDVASMANNHGMDFGPASVTDGLAAAKATGFPVVGIGTDAAQAFAPWVAEVKGWRIAFIGATDVLDDHLQAAWTAGDGKPGLASAKGSSRQRLLDTVWDTRSKADTVVVFLHWGIEGQTCPSANQKSLAAELVEAGADVVVGSHAHRLMGGGRLGEAVVHYGLGNFAFYASSGPGTNTGVFTVQVQGHRAVGYDWVPATIRGGVPRPLSGSAAASAKAAWNGLRACTDLTE